MPLKTKELQSEYQRNWRKARREKLAAIKDVPCIDCGGRFPHYVMDFDHRGDDKDYGISNMAIKNNWNDVLKEIAKCDIVCANCHRIRTHRKSSYIPKRWRTRTIT